MYDEVRKNMLRSKWKPNKDEVVAANGVVTAMQPPSAEAGLEILKKGGNAIDAAVAMGFCNVVVEPYMAGIAGLGYMLIYLAKEGKTIALDFNGRAPAKAHVEMYRVIGSAPAGGTHILEVEDDANRQGPLSVTVPATCAAFCLAHKLYGKLPLEQVLEPAIHLASEGFEANWYLTLYVANDFEKFSGNPAIASMWLPNGRPPRSSPKPGEKIVQRDLGELLKHIARQGADAMYRGEVADAIDEFMRKRGGFLTRKDLEDYHPDVFAPLSMSFKGCDIKVVPTPSGGITNLETFGIWDNFDLASMSHNSAEYLHLFIETARHALADRFRYLGDWDYAPVPLRGLLSKEYTKELAKQVDTKRAVVEVEQDQEPWVYYMERALHDPWQYDPSPRPDKPFGSAVADEPGNTTHLNVVDRERNMVTCTHTAGFAGGDTVPPGTGVYLAGGMSWLIPKPGYANSIAGWKRVLTNMSPLMILRDGKPVLCQGAPGARRIMNRGVQVVTNVLVFGMTPQEAIAQPTIDASGRDTLVDSRLPDDTIANLEKLGHRVKVVEQEPGTGVVNFSGPSAIYIDYEAGVLRAGVDIFRPAIALGY